MKTIFFIAMLFCFSSVIGQSKIPSAESQITTALYASPEMYKDGAKVLGYDQEGKIITLRDGNNGLICISSNPEKSSISVSCYSDKLEAYMSRGRALSAEGKNEVEKREIRKKEIDEEILLMPKEPAAAYMVNAKLEDYDMTSGTLTSSKIRYVLYKPYMSGAETGLPTMPAAPGMPWLMDADTHRSHIMITPASID